MRNDSSDFFFYEFESLSWATGSPQPLLPASSRSTVADCDKSSPAPVVVIPAPAMAIVTELSQKAMRKIMILIHTSDWSDWSKKRKKTGEERRPDQAFFSDQALPMHWKISCEFFVVTVLSAPPMLCTPGSTFPRNFRRKKKDS